MSTTISFSTHNQIELVDLTEQVEQAVTKMKVDDGICHLFVPHSTAAIVLNENEPGLISDIILKIQTLFPDADYEHNRVDDNAQAHLAAIFLGQNISLPIINGCLFRGTWQSILFVELDGPRNQRELVVTVR